MKRTLYGIIMSVLLCAAVAVGFARPAKAQEVTVVNTSFASSYTVLTDNSASVRILVHFTNDGENPTVLTSYDLDIGNVQVQEVAASISSAPLEFQILEENGVRIRVNLGEFMLRVGETTTVEVTYRVSNFFSAVAGTNEAFIPVFSTSEGACPDSFSVTYPEEFGQLNYTNVASTVTSANGDFTVTYACANSVDHIFLSAGSQKGFSFQLEKSLSNAKEMYIQQQIILPPDTDTQKIIITSISPYPDDAYRTTEGNYVLVYTISPGTEMWVRIGGIVSAFVAESSDRVLTSQELIVSTDTTQDRWAVTDEDLVSLLQEVDTSVSNKEKALWVNDYLLENLTLSLNFRQLHSYDYRRGANAALTSYKEVSAEDFADSFVGLARQLGLPSRLVAGYVFPYSVSQNVYGMFHVWPQYWDEQYGWVSIDPAYEEYTGFIQSAGTGLSRLITVIYPDGFDGLTYPETSDEFFLTGEIPVLSSKLTTTTDVAGTVDAGISRSGVLTVTNAGNTILRDLSFTQTSQDFDLSFSDPNARSLVLPGESISFEYELKVNTWYVDGEKTLGVTTVAEAPDGTQRSIIEEVLQVRPLSWAEPVAWLATLLVFVVVMGLFYLLGLLARTAFHLTRRMFAKLSHKTTNLIDE